MWGFFYSRNFGLPSMAFGLPRRRRTGLPRQLTLIFYGLLNVVTWAMGRLLHDHPVRRAAGHRSDLLRGRPHRRRSLVADHRPDQDPVALTPGCSSLIPRVRLHLARCSSSTEPKISSSNSPAGPHPPDDFTPPNMYAYQQAFSRWPTTTLSQLERDLFARRSACSFVYSSAAPYIFIRSNSPSRKRGNFPSLNERQPHPSARRVPVGLSAVTSRCISVLCRRW